MGVVCKIDHGECEVIGDQQGQEDCENSSEV